MKKISKFIKNNYKFLIGVIVGLLLSGTGVYAANTIYSSNVTYDNSNSGLDATNVQDALDETYRKCFPIVINITLDNGSGTGGVPILLYLVYNDGVYLDSNFTKKLSTSGNNKITVPTRTGYTFDGYY